MRLSSKVRTFYFCTGMSYRHTVPGVCSPHYESKSMCLSYVASDTIWVTSTCEGMSSYVYTVRPLILLRRSYLHSTEHRR